MVINLYDSATGKQENIVPRRPGEISMYVCGPTVYDVPHLGHGRFALVFDILRRYMEFLGDRVRYVSNITDIDDKIITRAQQEGRSYAEVAREFEDVWWSAMDSLGVARPDDIPHATEYVSLMVDAIGEMVDKGYAYEISDGIYFSTDSISEYGLLAHQRLDKLRAGARVEENDEKRSQLDFALWKRAKVGEPSWPSPWGEGRPGWHTECVVMSLGILGEGFDIHGGGADLAFPHHENERAQSIALGKSFARHWVHNGWVTVGGEKMAKSLGNYTSLSDFLSRSDPRAYRLLVLRSHYRSPMEVTPRTVSDAEESITRLDLLMRRYRVTSDIATFPDPATTFITMEDALQMGASRDGLDEFCQHMDDDLDTPGALAGVFELARKANSAFDAGATKDAEQLAVTVQILCNALGFTFDATDEKEFDEETRKLVQERDAARAARDWQRADVLRDELVRRGWIVEDTPDGTMLRGR
jgi:cysteinyl-tRNA synthetase